MTEIPRQHEQPQPVVRFYPPLQMAIHWLVVFLVTTQWYTSDAIPRTRSPFFPPSDTQLFMAAVHTYSGIAIGLMVLTRIYLRWKRPMPALQLPPWQKIATAIVHWGLYLGLIGQAATGVIAFYFWTGAARLHVALWYVTLVLVGIHLAAALYHIVRRDGAIWRMIPKNPF